MLHRAMYGSLERFLGIVLEQHGAQLPPWLAPLQLRVLPVSDAQLKAARSLTNQLAQLGIRFDLEVSGSLSRRIAEAHAQAVPCVAVIGAREAAAGSGSLRDRGGQRELTVSAALDELTQWCASPQLTG